MRKTKKSPGRPRGSKSQYLKVAARLRAKIIDSGWEPGSILPSIRSLATEWRVNRTVVSHALNLLKAEGRIRATPNRALAVSDFFKNALSMDNTVLVVSNIPIFKILNSLDASQLLKGIQIGVSRYSSSLLTVSAYEYRQVVPESFMSMPLRGAIVLGPCTPALIRKYERWNLPVVLLDQPGKGFKISSVSVDNENAAAEGINHLLALGHRRIAFQRQIITYHRDIDPDSKERQKGFERAICAAGLSFKSSMMLNRFRDDHPKSPSIQALFRKKPRITAVLCADGGGASLILQAAHIRGLSIPGDLSIAAFTSKGWQPPLGGPKIDFESMGMKAAALLEFRRDTIQHVRCPAVWELGRTIGSPA